MSGISRRSSLAAIVSALAVGVSAAPFAALASDIAQQARGFVEQSAARARAEAPAVKASGDARSRFAQLFSGTFDIDTLARNVMGSRWSGLSEAQRLEFRDAFGAYVIKAYADRFYTYAGQPMEVIGSESVASGAVAVRTIVRPEGGAAVPVEWQVAQVAAGMRVTDVVIDGVSLIRTQRDEFASVMRANGGDIAKLTALLAERAR